jgi:hypothetical protein
VKTHPVQARLPCDDLDISSCLMQQRGGLKSALPSTNYNYAMPFEPAEISVFR